MSEVKLYLGDCLSILPTLTGPIDAIITDLPYGTTACSWDVVIPFAPMWEQAKRLQAKVFVTTATQPFASLLVCSNLEWFKWGDIWKKSRSTGHLNCKVMPLRQHEDILVFGPGKVTYNPLITRKPRMDVRPSRKSGIGTPCYGKYDNNPQTTIPLDMSYPRSVVDFDNPNNGESGLHPTQKPVALYEYLVLTYTNPGDTVLDFCFGSGTTGVACVKLGRHFIGCEIRPDYYAIAERRIHDAQLQIPMPLDCQ